MAIRLPVVRRRRWVQRTALGASDVPDVNSRTHSASTSVVESVSLGCVCGRSPTASSASSREAPRGRRVVAVGEPAGDEHAARQFEALERRVELGCVAGLGEHQLQVRVHDVAGEMHAVARVVEPGDDRPAQGGTTECEDVIRRVVEQETDVRRPSRFQLGAEQRGEALRLGEELTVGPDPLAETKGRTVAVLGDVAPEQSGHVGCGERHLG